MAQLGHLIRFFKFQETVTVSLEEGNSAVSIAWEYGNFDGKQVTAKACSDFCCLTKFYKHYSYKMSFDYRRYMNI